MQLMGQFHDETNEIFAAQKFSQGFFNHRF